jgi:uncharacterized protein YegL
MLQRPGGEVASRPLHFIWILDCSGSMAAQGKMAALNNAIREAIPHMQKAAAENPNAKMLVRAVRFSTGADWHIKDPVPIEQFVWSDLTADGVTDMGKAFRLVTEQLRVPPMPERALPPVLVLASDGQATDDYKTALQELMNEEWGKKAVRMAIAIGKDADLRMLQDFIGHAELQPLLANNPESLVRQIRWASTVAIRAASSPKQEEEQHLLLHDDAPDDHDASPADDDLVW